MEEIDPKLDFIAIKLQKKGVAFLERLTTAQYVIGKYVNCKSTDERAKKLHRLKPHIPMPDALDAFSQIEELRQKAQRFLIT
jgi:hypothetical protein